MTLLGLLFFIFAITSNKPDNIVVILLFLIPGIGLSVIPALAVKKKIKTTWMIFSICIGILPFWISVASSQISIFQFSANTEYDFARDLVFGIFIGIPITYVTLFIAFHFFRYENLSLFFKKIFFTYPNLIIESSLNANENGIVNFLKFTVIALIVNFCMFIFISSTYVYDIIFIIPIVSDIVDLVRLDIASDLHLSSNAFVSFLGVSAGPMILFIFRQNRLKKQYTVKNFKDTKLILTFLFLSMVFLLLNEYRVTEDKMENQNFLTIKNLPAEYGIITILIAIPIIVLVYALEKVLFRDYHQDKNNL